jgi:hypothetical protein
MTCGATARFVSSLDGPARRCHLRGVAVRSDYRPVTEMSLPARVARAFAYVLLVITCTVIAALGGYQVGARSSPSEQVSAAQREAAVQQAVSGAVAKQKAADRRARREALRNLAVFQRTKFATELAARVSEVRLAEAANAARAYRRGKAAGRITAVNAATAEAGAGAKSTESEASQR